ncbi:hypothetical protein GOBAR_AA15002 [Gossypium barbadense]|uniref:Uncharacterized protein n=1 Tax=Gossypium barbadense TaxID=3634 RepID=A0A2P5XQN2_GOSBA|nr:hypothetical protein GOBAR_AA15002 [Gossypium barbadense]
METRDRPSGEGLGQASPFVPNGLLSSCLDNNNNGLGGTTSNEFSKQEAVNVHSTPPRNERNNLVRTNPVFEGPGESIVQLDANLLHPKFHLAIIFKDNNMSKSLKGHGPENKTGNNRGGPPLNCTFKENGGKLKKLGFLEFL